MNPEFVQTIEANYYFEETNKYVVEVYDIDDATNVNDLTKQELIGSYHFDLHSIVNSTNQELNSELQNPKIKKCGEIKIVAEELKPNHGQETL